MNVVRAVTSLPKRAATFLIGMYQQFISPRTPPTCKFVPTCSEYAVQSINRYGLIRGGWLAIKRLARCHPWSKGGFDPVP